MMINHMLRKISECEKSQDNILWFIYFSRIDYIFLLYDKKGTARTAEILSILIIDN